MKKLGCFLIFLTVIAVGFVGLFVLAGFLLNRSPDQSHLTREVAVSVVASEKRSKQHGSDWHIDYTYLVGNEWYAGKDSIDRHFWEPGQPLVACVDPEEPTRHVLKIGADDRCGEEFIQTGINTGTPTTAPTG